MKISNQEIHDVGSVLNCDNGANDVDADEIDPDLDINMENKEPSDDRVNNEDDDR